MPTLEELAADAFEKNERVKILETCNTPAGYEERKQAFIELAKARYQAAQALRSLQEFSGLK